MVSLASSLASLGADRKHLARRTGISLDRLDAIFSGAVTTATELRLISEALRLPPDALLRAAQISRRADVRYRKTPRKNSLAAEARIEQVAKFLSRTNLLPVPRAWGVEADLQSRPSIEHAATQIRAMICSPDEMIGPVTNLSDRIDAAGLASTIVMHDLGVEGASANVDGAPLIVVAARTYAPRMLFTCAHELAHIALGHTTEDGWLIDESTIEAFDSEDEQERISNTLASALLQPAKGVAKFLTLARKRFDIGDEQLSATEILLMSRYFGTSFYAAAMRLEHLGIAPVGTAASFQAAITEDHVSAEAYAERLGLPPRTPIKVPTVSSALKANISTAIENGQVSIGRVGDVLGYSLLEISHALT
jgi:Zn-dependent peptidase ImmA (M78 family)